MTTAGTDSPMATPVPGVTCGDAPQHPHNVATPTSLSGRQLQVLDGSARGLTVEQTARELGLSPSTIRHHRVSVLARLGAASTAQAVAVAFRRGLLS